MGKGEEKENTSVNITSIYDIVAKVASSERGVFFSMGHHLMECCSILDSSGLCLLAGLSVSFFTCNGYCIFSLPIY